MLLTGLDRLPLTIEMAAARLGSMTFDELALAIGEGVPMPVTHRSPVRRHRSLESLVAWSAELLNRLCGGRSPSSPCLPVQWPRLMLLLSSVPTVQG